MLSIALYVLALKALVVSFGFWEVISKILIEIVAWECEILRSQCASGCRDIRIRKLKYEQIKMSNFIIYAQTKHSYNFWIKSQKNLSEKSLKEIIIGSWWGSSADPWRDLVTGLVYLWKNFCTQYYNKGVQLQYIVISSSTVYSVQ